MGRDPLRSVGEPLRSAGGTLWSVMSDIAATMILAIATHIIMKAKMRVFGKGFAITRSNHFAANS
jgi:hypothetical protein